MSSIPPISPNLSSSTITSIEVNWSDARQGVEVFCYASGCPVASVFFDRTLDELTLWDVIPKVLGDERTFSASMDVYVECQRQSVSRADIWIFLHAVIILAFYVPRFRS